jgi:hypothetical protein
MVLYCRSAGEWIVFVSVFITWILEAFPVDVSDGFWDVVMRHESGDTVI